MAETENFRADFGAFRPNHIHASSFEQADTAPSVRSLWSAHDFALTEHRPAEQFNICRLLCPRVVATK